MDSKWKRTPWVALICLGLGVGACQEGEPPPGGEPASEEEMGALVDVPQPDTTAENVWEHLQQEDYRENWWFWPEREPFYQGTEPHGALLNTYLNKPAHDGLLVMRNNESINDLPFGSIIVKENFAPDSSLAAVTVMYKAEGFDPEHNDWWWMKRLADGTVEASGRVPSCIGCHEEAQHRDYLMTSLGEEGNSG